MGILRVTGLGLVALGLWAGMQSRTLEDAAPVPVEPATPAPASEQRRPAAYPFERKPARNDRLRAEYVMNSPPIQR